MRAIPEKASRGIRALGALCLTVLLAAAPAESPVADAAMRRDADAVRALLRQGADVNAAQADGMTALHWAGMNGDAELAKMLIYAGANLNATTRHGDHTPLHVAARYGRGPVVTVLVEAGANVKAVTTSGVTPLHHAALGGSAEAARALLEHGAEVDAVESAWNQTPLIFASALNRVEVMKVLLAAGANHSHFTRVHDTQAQNSVDRGVAQQARDQVLSTFRDQQGGAAASWRPGPREVQAAVQAAVQVQRSSAGAAGGQGGGAVGGGDEGVGGGGSTQGGLSPLLHAAREGNIEAVELLLDAGADINQLKRGDGYSALMLALINGHYDLGLRLVERGADPNLASASDGISPLWATISNFWGAKTRYPQAQYQHLQKASYLEMMEGLLKAGADPNYRIAVAPWYLTYTFGNLGVNFAGATAFFRAAHAVDVPAMRLLVAYGADPSIPTLVPGGAAGGRGGGGGGRGGGARAGGAGPGGAAPAPMGPQPGVYPIHAAAGVSYGQSYTANFHLHAPLGWMPAVKYLVEELGADVNARDNSGYTPLHHAASRGDNEMILYLVSKGADPLAVSARGQTTVDMANGPGQRITPFPATIALLESMGAINNHRCVSC
jgi:ankyrin repeat protein